LKTSKSHGWEDHPKANAGQTTVAAKGHLPLVNR